MSTPALSYEEWREKHAGSIVDDEVQTAEEKAAEFKKYHNLDIYEELEVYWGYQFYLQVVAAATNE
jgi:hypothetical protein